MSTAALLRPALLVTALLAATGARALETGDINLTVGYTDPKTGIVVEKVETDPKTGLQQITFRVPPKYSDIEEVIVTGRRPEKETWPQRRHYEKLDRDSQDYYGLVVYLGEHEDVPVRLYMDARQQQPGDITP